MGILNAIGKVKRAFNLLTAVASAPRDPEELRSAAERGHAGAQYVLGLNYAEGDGVPQDDREAAFWYRRAAEQGMAEAQCMLGAMYAAGEGVPQDNEEAAVWLRKAAAQGHPDAKEALRALEGEE